MQNLFTNHQVTHYWRCKKSFKNQQSQIIRAVSIWEISTTILVHFSRQLSKAQNSVQSKKSDYNCLKCQEWPKCPKSPNGPKWPKWLKWPKRPKWLKWSKWWKCQKCPKCPKCPRCPKCQNDQSDQSDKIVRKDLILKFWAAAAGTRLMKAQLALKQSVYEKSVPLPLSVDPINVYLVF